MAEPNKPIIAWMGYWSGAGSVDSVTKTTHFERVANEWKADGAEITPLVAARRPAPAGAEVVGWQWRVKDGDKWRPMHEDATEADFQRDICDYRPVYAAPVVSPPVEPQGEAVAYRLRAKSAADQGWRLFLPDDDGLDFYRSRKPEDDGGAYDVQPLYAAPPSPQSREGTRETGWLCEWLHATGPEWWSLGDATSDGGYFTKDSLKALRFGRKEDAQAYIEEAGWTEIVPTEHEWVGPPRALSQQER